MLSVSIYKAEATLYGSFSQTFNHVSFQLLEALKTSYNYLGTFGVKATLEAYPLKVAKSL